MNDKQNADLVSRRVERPGAGAVSRITLSDEEHAIYTGGGLRLARFIDGRLTAVFDPLNAVPVAGSAEDMARDAARAALMWAHGQPAVYVICIASGGYLCDPRPFAPDVEGDVATLVRMIFEEIDSLS